MFRKFKALVVLGVVGAASVLSASAQAIDLTATGTEIAGYVGTAATAGLAVLAAMYGLRILIRAFKVTAK
jgi:hypothetical protein